MVESLLQRVEELERANARSATPFSKGKPKPASEKKKPGRKGRKNGDKGDFKHREKPEIKPTDQVQRLKAQLDESADDGNCPQCGKLLEISFHEASTIDTPPTPVRLIKIFEVPVAKCSCGYCQRGKHVELAEGQHGATAHRIGHNIAATAHTLHYHHGVPVRKVPQIVETLSAIPITQSALTQQALKLGNPGGPVADRAEQYRKEISSAARVHTDDTGWKIGGLPAFLMGFGTDDTAYFQIRFRHRAKEVAEVIEAAFEGVLITDRCPTYDANTFELIDKQKCLSHILENLSKLEKKTKGRAKSFARKLKALLRRMLDLWSRQREGDISREDYLVEARALMVELDEYLFDRRLKNPDNASMLEELGWQNDCGNLTRFLEDPDIDPTNNFAERLLRGAVIARKVSQCSKNVRGANAYAAFKSVLATFQLRGSALVEELVRLMAPRARDPA